MADRRARAAVVRAGAGVRAVVRASGTRGSRRGDSAYAFAVDDTPFDRLRASRGLRADGAIAGADAGSEDAAHAGAAGFGIESAVGGHRPRARAGRADASARAAVDALRTRAAVAGAGVDAARTAHRAD